MLSNKFLDLTLTSGLPVGLCSSSRSAWTFATSRDGTMWRRMPCPGLLFSSVYIVVYVLAVVFRPPRFPSFSLKGFKDPVAGGGMGAEGAVGNVSGEVF